MKPDISLAGFINSLSSIFKLRNLIFLLGILISFISYYIIADYYEPFKNVLNYWNSDDDMYTFYSGSEGGFYHQIGVEMNKLDLESSEFSNSNIRIKGGRQTSGGLDNAVQVLSRKKSFGLIQESTLSKDDELRQKLNYVSPLYMERLHIICKNSILTGLNRGNYELSNKDSALINALFSQKSVSIGEVGSGTRVVGSYLLDVLGPKNVTIKGFSQKNGLDSLANDNLDVFMAIVGAPLTNYAELLSSGDYSLIGISPTLIMKINENFNTNYRVSNFKLKYPEFEDVNTIGSYAYLISSQDVEPRINLEFLRRLSFAGNKIKEEMDDILPKGGKFQLDEVAFKAGVEAQENDIIMEMYKSIILFIVSILISSFISIWVLVWIFSSIKMAKYFRKITRIYKKYYPARVEIERGKSPVFIGALPTHGADSINTLILGVDRLRELKTEVRDDYETGGISESHFRSLLSSVQNAIDEFRSSLSRAIVNDLSNNKENEYLTEYVFTNYYSSAFLDRETLLMN